MNRKKEVRHVNDVKGTEIIEGSVIMALRLCDEEEQLEMNAD